MIFQLLSFWQHWFRQLRHLSCFVLLLNICSLVYTLNMKRLTNEQRLQINEFYYQNTCSESSSESSWKILRKNLGLKPFKIQLVQELKLNNLPQNFWCIASWKVGRRFTFSSKTCVQRRSSFLAQWVCKQQNGRFWSEDQPEVTNITYLLTYVAITTRLSGFDLP